VDESPGDVLYRDLAAMRFEQLCRLSGVTNTKLAKLLGERLSRPKLTRQTLAGWRSGRQPVPMEAFLALLEVAGPAGLSFLLATTEEEFARLSTLRRRMHRSTRRKTPIP
jgi:transcriptional regulator with XRE-family HTH domain